MDELPPLSPAQRSKRFVVALVAALTLLAVLGFVAIELFIEPASSR